MIKSSELYRGAAPYYAQYVMPFSEEIFRSLVRVCRLTSNSRAIDLGAGTCLFGIPLARLVSHVLSVEPCDEMLQEGRRTAEDLGVTNMDFMISRSEDLNEPESSFDIATIADSFHFMDRARVLTKLTKMLKSDGCVAIVDGKIDGSEPAEWRNAMYREIEEFWGGSLPGGRVVQPFLLTVSHREVLRASTFTEITELRHYFELNRSVDDVLGYLHAMSVASPHVLGSRRDEFTTRIRRLLLSYSPSGSFLDRGHVTTLLAYRS